jgi:hypothetical protein
MLTVEFHKQKPVDNQNQVYDMTINMESTFTEAKDIQFENKMTSRKIRLSQFREKTICGPLLNKILTLKITVVLEIIAYL